MTSMCYALRISFNPFRFSTAEKVKFSTSIYAEGCSVTATRKFSSSLAAYREENVCSTGKCIAFLEYFLSIARRFNKRLSLDFTRPRFLLYILPPSHLLRSIRKLKPISWNNSKKFEKLSRQRESFKM